MANKLKVILTEGLPASGKSTYANNLVNQSAGNYVNVNRDDLRAMLGNGFIKRNEDMITQLQHIIITKTIQDGRNVVVSDTNIHKRGEKGIRDLISRMKLDVDIEIKTFDTPMKECIIRDRIREAQGKRFTGEKVIRRMYKEYFEDAVYSVSDYPVDPNLPWIILCDIDGTAAHMNNRGPFEWSRVGEDTVDNAVSYVLEKSIEDHGVVFMSGRDEICRKETEQWLRDNSFEFDNLFMRPQGDMRPDHVVKKELFDQHIRGKYNILFVLDDRDQVVNIWRSMGLKCLQVADGDF